MKFQILILLQNISHLMNPQTGTSTFIRQRFWIV